MVKSDRFFVKSLLLPRGQACGILERKGGAVMLKYNMDVTPESLWKRMTPSEAELAQPYYCTEAGLFYGLKHFSTARTDKESYILFYTLRGAGLIEQGGSTVTLGVGQALLLNCRTPQSYCTAPGQSCWHHYWVHLDGAGVAAMEKLLHAEKKLVPVQLTGARMQELFELALSEIERDTVESMVRRGAALHEMLALWAQNILSQGEALSVRQVILQAAKTVREHYQEELSLSGLLEEAHMSKSYFLRLFRRYLGTTPYNYLVNYRITQAKELLVLTDHTVSEIAREVGFGDASNFSTRFSRATGQSPLQYRKNALKSVDRQPPDKDA